MDFLVVQVAGLVKIAGLVIFTQVVLELLAKEMLVELTLAFLFLEGVQGVAVALVLLVQTA
jgi:hypothetical protein